MSLQENTENFKEVNESELGKREGRPLFYGVNVVDNRLAVTDSLPYGIFRGGANVTAHRVQASSATVSGCQFQLNVPTLSTVVDRHVLIEIPMTFSISGIAANTTQLLGTKGTNIALAPFPFHQCCSSAVVTINNASINVNMQDCLAMLMHMIPKDTLEQVSSICASRQDYLLNYNSVAVTSPLNVLSDALTWSTNGIPPRGLYNVTLTPDIAGNGNGTDSRTVTVSALLVEPLLLSPFLLGHKSQNEQGIYGVQTLGFNFNFASSNIGAVRADGVNCPAGFTSSTITNVDQANTYLHFTLISPPVGSAFALPARNIVPYTENFIQKSSGINLSGTTVTATSNTLNLHQIPDRIAFCIRKKLTVTTPKDTDSFLPITGVNITFCNTQGILSNQKPFGLWQMAVEAGSNQTYPEFVGKANVNGVPVSTCGSVGLLQFGKHINISESWYAPGSVGSFAFQMNVTAGDNTGGLTAANYELVIMFMYSGYIISELSSTSVYVGILSKKDVITASEQKPVSMSGGLYGSGWHSMLSGLKKGYNFIKPQMKHVKGMHDTYKQQRSGSGFTAGRLLNRLEK
jgi:hypothetical protein